MEAGGGFGGGGRIDAGQAAGAVIAGTLGWFGTQINNITGAIGSIFSAAPPANDAISGDYNTLNAEGSDGEEKKIDPATVAPTDRPRGTRPIDDWGIGRGDIHEIKGPRGLGAGANDWVGITPEGDVITTGQDGRAVNNGHVDTFTRRPLRQFPRQE